MDRYDIKITDNEYFIMDSLKNEVEAVCYSKLTAVRIKNTLNGFAKDEELSEYLAKTSIGRCMWEDTEENCGHCEYYSKEESKCRA